MSDPIEPIRRIGDRLAELAEELGLQLIQFALMPDFERHGHDAITAVFAVPDSIPEPTLDLPDMPELAPIPELDDELAAILNATEEQEKRDLVEEQEKAEREQEDDIAQRLMDLRSRVSRPGKGFLDD